MNVGYKIKEIRKQAGLTQIEFSKKVGITQAMLSSYESKKVIPTLDILCSIATHFDVSLDWLCELSNKYSINSEINNMGELFETLITVLEESMAYVEIINFDTNTKIKQAKICFDQIDYVDILTDYNKMKNSLANGYIDYEIFDLWKEKTINKYKSTPTTASLISKISDKTKDPE